MNSVEQLPRRRHRPVARPGQDAGEFVGPGPDDLRLPQPDLEIERRVVLAALPDTADDVAGAVPVEAAVK